MEQNYVTVTLCSGHTRRRHEVDWLQFANYTSVQFIFCEQAVIFQCFTTFSFNQCDTIIKSYFCVSFPDEKKASYDVQYNYH